MPFTREYRAPSCSSAGVVFGLAQLAGGFEDDAFWLEAVEIALFGPFWYPQPLQHWDGPTD